EPQEVDVHRQIPDRIELKIARDHPMLGAVDLELVDAGEKAPGIDALPELGVIDRDIHRRLAVAVDHAGYAAGSTLCPGGPLAGPCARRRLHLFDGRHGCYPLESRNESAASAARSKTATCLQGCLDRGLRALIAADGGKYKKTGGSENGVQPPPDP